jgi:uncharacterized protein YqjF (DUF2071 family)
MRMNWHDLLFLHWPVPENLVRPLVPAGLELDRFDGRTWIGVVPFYMTGVRPRIGSKVFAFDFPEVNVRTYVRRNGRLGVWFFSLDAGHRLAVLAARCFFHLPYEFATMSSSCSGNLVDFRSRRVSTPNVEIAGRYKPIGEPFRSVQGSLEYWLTERYCLFSVNKRGDIFFGEVHHPPWPLQSAEAEMERNSMTALLGIPLPAEPPLLHFAKRLDVVAWSLARC